MEWAGIHPPIFHFAMDQHAIIADMDRPFIAAYDFIAASRASPKCKSLLITLNQVGMLCLNKPVAHNLLPLFLFPSHPLPWAVFYRPPKQPTPPPPPPPPLHGPPRCQWQPRLPLRRRATTTGPESSPLQAQESSRSVAWPLPPCRRASTGPSCPANGPHPAMRTRRRRAPTGPAAGSQGLDKPAPGGADIKHSSLRKAMQRRHAAASRTSRNRSKNPAGYMAGDLGISRKISKDMFRILKDK